MERFEAVYSQYYDVVFRYAVSLCRDECWAEEITQEAFFKALRRIDSYRGECKLSVWLCQIAKNTFYTQAQKRKRENAESISETLLDTDEPEQKIWDKQQALELHKVLHTLGEPYKEIFWMRTFGELSFKEIGALFDKTESWARVTYHRAKMKLKEGIE